MEQQQSPQPELNPKTRLQLTIKDLDTGAESSTKIEFVNDGSDEVRHRVHRASGTLLSGMGFSDATKTESDMSDEKPKEQDHDLTDQKPEETDNIQKSERPADDYMDSKGLDRETHGKKKEE